MACCRRAGRLRRSLCGVFLRQQLWMAAERYLCPVASSPKSQNSATVLGSEETWQGKVTGMRRRNKKAHLKGASATSSLHQQVKHCLCGYGECQHQRSAGGFCRPEMCTVLFVSDMLLFVLWLWPLFVLLVLTDVGEVCTSVFIKYISVTLLYNKLL